EGRDPVAAPRRFGEPVSAGDVRARRDPREHAFLLREPPRHLDRLVVGDRLQVVDPGGIPLRHNAARPALDKERPALAALIAAEPAGSCAWMMYGLLNWSVA